MPQIRCPNCGQTINLENRKKIDVNLIIKAVQKKERTFTDLLHLTKLPRKTLSLRLKELRGNGAITKTDGMYRLDENYKMTYTRVSFAERFSAPFHDGRKRAAIMLLALLIGFPISAQVFATLFMHSAPPSPIIQEPAILGNFTTVLEVHDVSDLYAWQSVTIFDSSKLKILDIRSGPFLDVEFPFFVTADLDPDVVAVGGTLCGAVSGISGSGMLAIIIFGYFEEDYEAPRIVSAWNGVKTCWIDSLGSGIPFDSATFTLSIIEE